MPNNNELASDEVYCTSCGEVIKESAEICPDCGVRQIEEEEEVESSGGTKSIPEARRYELEKIANKDKTTTMLVGFFLSPVGYIMLGKWGLAILNFITLNYFLLGIIIVPFHCKKIIDDANEELHMAGVEGY